MLCVGELHEWDGCLVHVSCSILLHIRACACACVVRVVRASIYDTYSDIGLSGFLVLAFAQNGRQTQHFFALKKWGLFYYCIVIYMVPERP